MKIRLGGSKFTYCDLKVPHYIVAMKGKEIRLFKSATVLSCFATRRIVKHLLADDVTIETQVEQFQLVGGHKPELFTKERKRRFHIAQIKDVIEMQAIYEAAAQGRRAEDACTAVLGSCFKLSATVAEGVLTHVNAHD